MPLRWLQSSGISFREGQSARRCIGIAFALALALGAVAPSGCVPGDAFPDRQTIVVSVPPLAYFANRLAGDRFNVSALVPPGTDPHHFEPSMSQLLDLNRAVLYLEIGHPRLEFETMLRERHFEDYPDLPILSLVESTEMMPEDPHVWTSPRVAEIMARKIAARLREMAPDDPELETRLQGLLNDIHGVDEKLRRWSLRPEATRSFISHHPAWAYLARDYGLRQIAIHRNHAEPSAARLAQIVERGVEEKVRIVVVQPGYSEEAAQIVATEIGAVVVVVDPLGANWFDEMNRLADAFLRSDEALAGRETLSGGDRP